MPTDPHLFGSGLLIIWSLDKPNMDYPYKKPGCGTRSIHFAGTCHPEKEDSSRLQHGYCCFYLLPQKPRHGGVHFWTTMGSPLLCFCRRQLGLLSNTPQYGFQYGFHSFPTVLICRCINSCYFSFTGILFDHQRISTWGMLPNSTAPGWPGCGCRSYKML